MLENNVCNVCYIVLSFMSIIIRCYPILRYLFMSAIIMFVGGIYYKLLSFFLAISKYVYLIVYNMFACIYVGFDLKLLISSSSGKLCLIVSIILSTVYKIVFY